MTGLSIILFCFCKWWWLLWLLPALLGWLLGRSMSSKTVGDGIDWKSKYDQSQRDLAECRKSKSSLKAAASTGVASMAAVKREEPAAPKKTGAWAKLKEDNLQFIEGIGPKMNEVLNENGVRSWSKLADMSRNDLKNILAKYGDKYQIIEPGDWPRQAKYAAEEDWDGLIKYQSDDGSAAKVRTLFIKLGIMDEDGNYKS